MGLVPRDLRGLQLRFKILGDLLNLYGILAFIELERVHLFLEHLILFWESRNEFPYLNVICSVLICSEVDFSFMLH